MTRRTSSDHLLEIRELTKYFGGLCAVKELNLSIKKGEILGLIGPNGAGKTTVFNLITGVHKPTKGKIIFDNQDITGQKTHLIAALGIARAFQFPYIFPNFTVVENVVASFNVYPQSGFWEALFNTHSYREKEKKIYEETMVILKLLGLENVKNTLAMNLPYRDQKLLTIARSLAVQPKLLLLDEPIGGMSHHEVNTTLSTIQSIRSQGITIVMVEHNMRAMELCDRVVVMHFGSKIAEGSIHDIRRNEEVIKAYFGLQDNT